jgi:hypothetical protein
VIGSVGYDLEQLVVELRRVETNFDPRNGPFAGATEAAPARVLAPWGDMTGPVDDSSIDSVRIIRKKAGGRTVRHNGSHVSDESAKNAPIPSDRGNAPVHSHGIKLDYALPDTQLDPAEQREKERREALENYNESTFGERHPSFVLFRAIAAMVVMFFVALLLPRQIGELIAFVLITGYVAWERWRSQ